MGQPVLPDTGVLARFGIEIRSELHEGEQSRVFDAAVDGSRAALKFTDARFTDEHQLTSRCELVKALSAVRSAVLEPVEINGALVHPEGDWLLTATRFVEGSRLEASSSSDAERLGVALARLHDALRRLPGRGIPVVRALALDPSEPDEPRWQVLHGDFSVKNVIVASGEARIFDFDDCGYGPIQYDVANSLYMVYFDAWLAGDWAAYDVFRPAFLAGYRSTAEDGVADADIAEMIEVRVQALNGWLEDLSTAPIGIRTATAAWHEELSRFVRDHAVQGGK